MYRYGAQLSKWLLSKPCLNPKPYFSSGTDVAEDNAGLVSVNYPARQFSTLQCLWDRVVMLGSLDVGQGGEQIHQHLWCGAIFEKI